MGNEPEPNPPQGQILIYRDGTTLLQVRLEGRTVWLTQRLIAELYQVSVKTVNEHLINISMKANSKRRQLSGNSG